LTCNVAFIGLRVAASLRYRPSCRFRLLLIGIEKVDRSAIPRKGFRDCPANATGTAGDDGGFAVQPEWN